MRTLAECVAQIDNQLSAHDTWVHEQDGDVATVISRLGTVHVECGLCVCENGWNVTSYRMRTMEKLIESHKHALDRHMS